MKKCKYCQSEIDAKAKVCPNCRKKQGPKIVKWVVIGLLALIVVSCVAGGGEDEKEKFVKDYTQDQVVTYEDVEYSIIKVEKTQGTNEFCKPKDGKEYVKVTVRIKNNSDEKISYNGLDWQMVNANGVEDAWGSYTCDDDDTLSSGELDKGGVVEGVLVWEEPKGDDNLRLRYYSNVVWDDEYTFQWKLN